jgi:ketosteroid isomerase-like protein
VTDFDEIRNTIARNNHALDDRRYDDCVRTYALDGVIAGRRGHTAIREFMNGQELATRPELERRHVNTNIAVTVTGDLAEAVSDLLVYDKVADGPWTLTAVGRYTDSLARQADGSWLFAERKLRFI